MANNIKKIQLVELVTYKDLTFDILLDYYYDEVDGIEYFDVELGNKNLQKIKDKYNELKKEL